MILDKISNKHLYINIHPLFAKVFSHLDDYLKTPVLPGKYEIRGADLYVMVQEYETRDAGVLEVHRNYIDVQCMVEGIEKVGYAQLEDAEPKSEYNDQNDVQFLQDPANYMEFLLKAGDFAIFFSHDAHKPSLNIDNKSHAKKLVFKVKIDAQ